MNGIRRNLGRPRRQAGQSIFQTMLIISCVAMAVALVFPIIELVTLYQGPEPQPGRMASPAPARATTEQPAAPVGDTDATPAAPEAGEGETAAPDEAGEPVPE